MANYKSAIKRIRQAQTRRLRNRYYDKSARTAIKQLREETDKDAALEKLPKVSSMIDRLVKKNIIHKNKAGNLKSKLTKHVNDL
ncbi:30S ribosomal protein S20 [Flavobacteriaceae bacterium Ap0902]|nr:30S ribosomal protein S20 [Flavobacteriaceae bacterium Ap0902]